MQLVCIIISQITYENQLARLPDFLYNVTIMEVFHMRHHTFRKIMLACYLPAAANFPLLFFFCRTHPSALGGIGQHIPYLLTILIICFCVYAWLSLIPYPNSKYASIRITVMMGGRTLCYCALYTFLFQAILYSHLIFHQPETVIIKALASTSNTVLLWNAVFSLLFGFLLLWNGILRIFFTSIRLRLGIRLLMLLAMWIPVVNLFVLLYALRKVHAEYDFECYKASVRAVRAESNLCKTRYPLVMVHGVGFRDLRYFNYWGRIPRELTRYGATVYYGTQEAFATIATNARDLQGRIQAILQETGAKKVNIIAHSKGGLDSRYAITHYKLGAQVASLTTICTPHHGCRFVDYACKLPEGLYRTVAHFFDWWFGHWGDSHPDFYTATHQFSTTESRRFNEQTPDVPGVYYQSYASKMRGALSDLLLAVPYCMIWPLEGDNDGLVSTGSARWGDFRGVIENRYRRGISHADMIDLKREDYKDFDIAECFVEIVSELKRKGF